MGLDFAPGDTVRYVGGGDTERPYFIGKIGTFLYLDSPGEAVVDFTNTEGVYGENAKTVYPFQLELYKEKTMPNPNFHYTDKAHPASSVIDSLYYNRFAQVVYVVFSNYGSTPRAYSDITSTVWQAWKAAPSAGQYYNAYIKGLHSTAGHRVPRADSTYTDKVATPQSKFSVTVSVAGTAVVSVDADNLMDAVKAAQDKFAADGFTVTVTSATAL